MTADRREAVDHPSHYGGGSNVYEAIKVIRAASRAVEAHKRLEAVRRRS